MTDPALETSSGHGRGYTREAHKKVYLIQQPLYPISSFNKVTPRNKIMNWNEFFVYFMRERIIYQTKKMKLTQA